MGTQAFYGSMFQTADAFLPPRMSGVELRIDSVVLAHPLAWNCVFAAVQAALGAGLLWFRTVRVTLAASILWSLSVWVFGEGLGGLASPLASIVSGAPGPALVYAWAAVLLWPQRREGTVPVAKGRSGPTLGGLAQLAGVLGWDLTSPAKGGQPNTRRSGRGDCRRRQRQSPTAGRPQSVLWRPGGRSGSALRGRAGGGPAVRGPRHRSPPNETVRVGDGRRVRRVLWPGGPGLRRDLRRRGNRSRDGADAACSDGSDVGEA